MRQVRNILSFRGRNDPGGDELDHTIRAWKTADEGSRDRLSDAARTSILAAARRRHAPRPKPFGSLFAPAPRLALAGAVPALLLSIALGYLLLPVDVPVPVGDSSVRVEAHKRDGDVVFLIANGRRAHQVFRSSRPDAAADEAYATTDRAFRDRLDAGGDVVFYRIE